MTPNPPPELNVLALFAGIGGLELGLERAGMRTVGQVEIDPFCRRVLAKHWPNVPRHDDVRTAVDWWRSEPRPRVDVVSGGFPCQDIALPGRRAGIIDGERSSLWSFMADAVRELRPRYVVVENVAAVLSRSRDGVIPLEVVAADLAEIGFDLRWDCIPAASVGACHRRDRWFGVAYPDRAGLPDVQGGSPLTERAGWRTPDRATWWRTEPDVGRVVHGVPSRLDRRDNRRRIHALGNAVVPQVSEYVGRLIVDHHLAACAA